MATVTFEIDDAIFQKGEELLADYGGVAGMCQAIVVMTITHIAAGTLPTEFDTPEGQKYRDEAVDYAVRHSYQKRVDAAQQAFLDAIEKRKDTPPKEDGNERRT